MRHAELVGELEALVAEHPFRERLRGQLMLALYRSGRQADALAVYQEARKLLVEELGIDPSPGLQQLEGAMLRQEPTLEAVPRARADVPLAGPVPAREVRKTVTVAALGVGQPADGLDPEALRRVRRRVATAVSKAAARHGGTMAGIDPGESLVAVFGLPTVHEDDALRAVRALVELRAQEIPLRAGLETGEIVVSGRPAGGGATHHKRRRGRHPVFETPPRRTRSSWARPRGGLSGTQFGCNPRSQAGACSSSCPKHNLPPRATSLGSSGGSTSSSSCVRASAERRAIAPCTS